MEVWPITTIFMIFIASTKLYKITEDEIETVVTSKPINFENPLTNFNQATELAIGDNKYLAHSTFKPSKKLLVFSQADFEKYERLEPSSSINMLSRQIKAPKNVYKHLLKLSTQPETYDLEKNLEESEEVEDKYNFKESLIYGKPKPILDSYNIQPLYVSSFNPSSAKHESLEEYNNFENAKKKHYNGKHSQDIFDENMEDVDDNIQQPNNNHFLIQYSNGKKNRFEDDFWQQQKYLRKQKNKSKDKKFKRHQYGYETGMEYKFRHRAAKNGLHKQGPDYHIHKTCTYLM